MRPLNRKVLRMAAVLALLQLACAHAPPATGRFRGPGAGPYTPDYPEYNCDVNTTIDCRPPQNGP